MNMTVLNWKGQTINAAMMHPSPKGLKDPIALYTTPQDQSAQIAELKAQLARYEVVGEIACDARTGHVYNILFLGGKAQSVGTKLFALKDEK